MFDGKRIRAIRSALGWSLRELADKSGVGKTTISDLENNLTNPTTDTIEKLAKALGCKVGRFFEKE